MKTIAIVPARGGSKGLPDKNIVDIFGKPLICHTLNQLTRCNQIDHIHISTDSQRIADVCINHGFNVPFLRDSQYAQDETTMEATLQHSLEQVEASLCQKFDICVFVTPTDILRQSSWIDLLVTNLKSNPNLESSFMGLKSFRNFWSPTSNKRLLEYMKIYGQRQERDLNNRFVYQECTGIGCASRSFLWRDGRRIGDRVKIMPLPKDYLEIDIHSYQDICLLESLDQDYVSQYIY